MKYILWGRGVGAERFYYQYRDKIDILFCVDSNCSEGSRFHELGVYSPEAVTGVDAKILIATSQYYNEIKETLTNKGYLEYQDFIYCFDFDKKIVFIHGNCHCRVIKKYLQSSDIFSENYTFGDWPLIFECDEDGLDEQKLKACDVFIHQDIQGNNSKGYRFSDEYILPKLKKDCIKICIPNLYGFPKAMFFSQSENNPRGGKIGGMDNPFFYAEKVIDKAISENIFDETKVLDMLQGDFENCCVIQNQWESDLLKWRTREESWDIDIIDFIEENYQKKQLFYDIGHPSNYLLKEIANRILKLFKIDELVKDIDAKWELDAHEVPVYPCIRRALSLEWTQQFIRKSSYAKIILGNGHMDFEEYIREYIYWSYIK